jgi:hypothetical protein
MVLAGKPERSMHRWEDDFIMDLKEIKWEKVEQGSMAGSCEQGYEPSGSIKC